MSDSPHSTLNSPITQQLAVEIQIGDGPLARIITMPVADTAAGLALQERINKTPGKLILAKDTENPTTIHCGRVIFMQLVLMPPQVQMPPPPKLARVN